jgi:hypothetical protein
VVATRGDGQVEVAWTPPAPRPDGTPGDNGDPISSYTVTAFRADDNAEVASIQSNGSPATVTGLENGTAYYVKVRATNGVGTGPDSTASNTVTPAGPPFAPTGVNAFLDGDRAIVRWTAPDDNGSPITGYTVSASPGGSATTVGGDTTSATISDLEEGTGYTFTVVATNEIGDSEASAPSDAVSVADRNQARTTPAAAGRRHSLVVMTDGTIFAWGQNTAGQLGDGTTTANLDGVRVSNLSDVMSVAAGENHSLAVLDDGSVWGWGANGDGQIGSFAATPQEAMAAGAGHSLALRSDGTVWAWGDNSAGQLGNGTSGTAQSTPVQVLGLNNPVALAGGEQHSVAVEQGGATWGWGSNEDYQLGNDSNQSSSTPVRVLQSNPDEPLGDVVTVAARGDYSVTILAAGAVREFGVHADGAICIVADPKITIVPGFEPTFFIPTSYSPTVIRLTPARVGERTAVLTTLTSVESLPRGLTLSLAAKFLLWNTTSLAKVPAEVATIFMWVPMVLTKPACTHCLRTSGPAKPKC